MKPNKCCRKYLQAYKDKLNDEGLGKHPELESSFYDPQKIQDYLEQKKNAGV